MVVHRCLHAVANLGIADSLRDAPQTAAMLAAATGVHAGALARVLRLLAAYGVFAYRDGLFSHSAASLTLRADHPQSMRPLVRMLGLDPFWTAFGGIEYSLRTGRRATEHVLPGGGVWEYLAGNAEASQIFDAAMTAKAYGQVAGVVGSYDFSGFNSIGDIGGGRGHLLQGVLATTPGARGVLFDQPHVIAQASDVATERLELRAGDFFTDALPACDAYMLMDVIHDWDDEEALKILEQVRAAAPAHATVLIVEAIIPDDYEPGWAKTLDMWMLALGGKQRTQGEFADLLSGAGFTFTREIDTKAGASIIEATAA